jgi:P-type Cu2+ transporter
VSASLTADDAAGGVAPVATRCRHCGQPAPAGEAFCCSGCAAAAEIIRGLGLAAYYDRRALDPAGRPPRPEEAPDITRAAGLGADGSACVTLAVEGLHCGACVWLIESVLARRAGLIAGRVNMTTRRLSLRWKGGLAEGAGHVAAVAALGYRLVPYDPAALAAAEDREGRALVRAMAVAGFVAGNVMLFSIATWIGAAQGMGEGAIATLHWLAALLVLPAVAYSGRPFFTSAARALAHRRTNMDVPISVGLITVCGLSLAQTVSGGAQVYFDSAATLLFFLLIGRVLDHRARAEVRRGSVEMLALRGTSASVLRADGTVERRAADAIRPGEILLVASGERIAADGEVATGESEIDQSLVTGESLPIAVRPGSAVYAGTLNLGASVTVRARAAGEATLLAECVRMIEAAQARRGRIVALADRVAGFYTPVVHVAAATTFLLWWLSGAGIVPALTTASAVLIITCPCALALAIPAAQVIAAGRLFARGVMLKSPLALERLAEVDDIAFDKTGTLTEPMLVPDEDTPAHALAVAASLAAASRHPLARALVEAQAASGAPVKALADVVEHRGEGLSAQTPAGEIRLGRASFCGVAESGTDAPELVLTRPGHAPARLRFAEKLREDAAAVTGGLARAGHCLHLLSGDREGAVRRAAQACGIAHWSAGATPADKVAKLEAWRAAGRHVLMVGDGLNDAPSLAAAHVSMSPATATEASQAAADLVYRGRLLAPVAEALRTARQTRAIMRENLALAFAYNAVMLPLAASGWVQPWLAAVAMSSSSLLVLGNSLRLQR